MCEHECNVGEKYVLPQAYAFGLTWSMDPVGLDNTCGSSSGRTRVQPPLLGGCLITVGGLLYPLILLVLFLKYKISLFFLKVEKGRSGKSNIDNMMFIKD